jgi:GntR family transcriptional regulator
MVELVKAPIYQQLNAVLRELIECGDYQTGSKFLTEREISERFKVSRATTNKALSNLVSEGILEFRKGIGTFVAKRIMAYDLRQLVSFTAKAEAAGFAPSTRILHFGEKTGSEADTETLLALNAHESDQLLYMERIRFANDLPVILERRYITASECPGLTIDDISNSIYGVWTGKYGLKISGADQTVQAVNIDDHDAGLLALQKGSAGLLVISTGYIDNGRPLWFERTLYRGDAYTFRNHLAGPGNGQPMAGSFLFSQS